MQDNQMMIIDEEGNEIMMEVLFTFDSEETNKSYVLYFNPNAEEVEVYASIYDEEGRLDPITDSEEWAMIEEVYQSFTNRSECGDGCDCGGDCDCDNEEGCGDDCGCGHSH